MRDRRSRRLAVLLGLGTVGFGVAPVLAPRTFSNVFDLPVRDDPRLHVMVRSVGVRDAAIGTGLFFAAARGQALQPWLMARIASDWGDALAVGVAIARGARQPRFVALGTLALLAALCGSALYWLDAR